MKISLCITFSYLNVEINQHDKNNLYSHIVLSNNDKTIE